MKGDEIFKLQPGSVSRIPYSAEGITAFFSSIRESLEAERQTITDTIVNQAEIDPIIALILTASAKAAEGKYYFEIAIPQNHAFDHDKILAFFSDATVYCHRGRPNVLKGTATDPNVGAYLYSKYQERSHCSLY